MAVSRVNWFVMALPVAGLIVLIVGVVAVVFALAGRKSDDEESSHGGSAWLVLAVIGGLILLLACGGVSLWMFRAVGVGPPGMAVQQAAPPAGLGVADTAPAPPQPPPPPAVAPDGPRDEPEADR